MTRAVSSTTLLTLLAACSAPAPGPSPTPPEEAGGGAAAALRRSVARFAPTDLTADLSGLSDGDRRALGHLVRAAQVMDALFLRQVWAGNEAAFYDLARDESPLGRARLHAFVVNKGPWSRLDHNEPFIPGVPAKPP